MKTKFLTFCKAWTEVTNIPFAALGIAYLGIYSIEVIYASNKVLVSNLEKLGNLIWLVFIFDLIIRFVSLSYWLSPFLF
jgi:hypothetical protein